MVRIRGCFDHDGTEKALGRFDGEPAGQELLAAVKVDIILPNGSGRRKPNPFDNGWHVLANSQIPAVISTYIRAKMLGAQISERWSRRDV